jgi:hypothetical protein
VVRLSGIANSCVKQISKKESVSMSNTSLSNKDLPTPHLLLFTCQCTMGSCSSIRVPREAPMIEEESTGFHVFEVHLSTTGASFFIFTFVLVLFYFFFHILKRATQTRQDQVLPLIRCPLPIQEEDDKNHCQSTAS